VTWAGFDDERVEALGLDYEVVHAGTDAALFAEPLQNTRVSGLNSLSTLMIATKTRVGA